MYKVYLLVLVWLVCFKNTYQQCVKNDCCLSKSFYYHPGHTEAGCHFLHFNLRFPTRGPSLLPDATMLCAQDSRDAFFPKTISGRIWTLNSIGRKWTITPVIQCAIAMLPMQSNVLVLPIISIIPKVSIIDCRFLRSSDVAQIWIFKAHRPRFMRCSSPKL